MMTAKAFPSLCLVHMQPCRKRYAPARLTNRNGEASSTRQQFINANTNTLYNCFLQTLSMEYLSKETENSNTVAAFQSHLNRDHFPPTNVLTSCRSATAGQFVLYYKTLYPSHACNYEV